MAAPEGGGGEVREQARGVTDENWDTARGGRRTNRPGTGCERVELTLPGALRTLPTNTSQAEAQLRA